MADQIQETLVPPRPVYNSLYPNFKPYYNLYYTPITKKKVVFNLEVHEEKIKEKVIKVVCGLSGIESVSVDMKNKKLTLIGDIDAVCVVGMLRKFCHAEISSVGSANIDPLMFYGTHTYHDRMKQQCDPNSCVIM